MNNDFRQRVFLPIVMPLGVVVGFFGFAWMLSRVLLAVPESASTAIALGMAAYILVIAAVVVAKPRLTSNALAIGVTLGLVGVLTSGLVAAAAGPREIEHAEGGEEAAAPAGEHEPAGASEEPAATGGAPADDGQLAFTAVDIEFAEGPSGTVPAGEAEIVLTNDGSAPHNVKSPDLSDTPIVEAAGGESATDTVMLEPGTYEYFCSVPGHETLMTGEFTVE